MFDLANTRIGIVGLGYVGLPLAVEFGKQFPTIGLDINADRIRELQVGHDSTLEVTSEELRQANHLRYTDRTEDLAACNVYIVTVPTPVDSYKRPDFSPLIGASTTVGRLLKPGDVAIYESTVYPGATEEVCVPILERESGLRFNAIFSPAIARNASTPVTRITGLPAFSRSLQAPHRKRRRSWTHCIGASLPPALTAPPASAWRKPPR
jgi:UDP-N-acetyl-D-galactosamine dehydrogenase